MKTLKMLDRDSINELIGQYYMCAEIEVAIKTGQFATLSELEQFIREHAVQLDLTIKSAQAGEPQQHDDCFLVLKPLPSKCTPGENTKTEKAL